MFNKICVILCLIVAVRCAKFMVTSQIYLDIRHNRQSMGRIVIGLFGNDAPKTVENFRHICLKGIDGKTYADTKFHRVIDRFIIQAGDIVSNDGFGSISKYGKYFDDENLTIEHTGPGFVGMANRGLNTNGCQFYITTMPTPWLNGKHTIFGKVVEGQDVVHKIEKVKTDTDDMPVKPVFITSCGEIPTEAPFEVSDELYSLWNWILATGPPLGMSLFILGIFHYFIRKLNMFC